MKSPLSELPPIVDTAGRNKLLDQHANIETIYQHLARFYLESYCGYIVDDGKKLYTNTALKTYKRPTRETVIEAFSHSPELQQLLEHIQANGSIDTLLAPETAATTIEREKSIRELLHFSVDLKPWIALKTADMGQLAIRNAKAQIAKDAWSSVTGRVYDSSAIVDSFQTAQSTLLGKLQELEGGIQCDKTLDLLSAATAAVKTQQPDISAARFKQSLDLVGYNALCARLNIPSDPMMQHGEYGDVPLEDKWNMDAQLPQAPSFVFKNVEPEFAQLVEIERAKVVTRTGLLLGLREDEALLLNNPVHPALPAPASLAKAPDVKPLDVFELHTQPSKPVTPPERAPLFAETARRVQPASGKGSRDKDRGKQGDTMDKKPNSLDASIFGPRAEQPTVTPGASVITPSVAALTAKSQQADDPRDEDSWLGRTPEGDNEWRQNFTGMKQTTARDNMTEGQRAEAYLRSLDAAEKFEIPAPAAAPVNTMSREDRIEKLRGLERNLIRIKEKVDGRERGDDEYVQPPALPETNTVDVPSTENTGDGYGSIDDLLAETGHDPIFEASGKIETHGAGVNGTVVEHSVGTGRAMGGGGKPTASRQQHGE